MERREERAELQSAECQAAMLDTSRVHLAEERGSEGGWGRRERGER